MLHSKARFLVLGLIGSAVMFAAGVSPEDAVSNLAAWARLLGIDKPPALLSAPSADFWGFWIGATAVGVSLFFLFRPQILRWFRWLPNKVPPTSGDWAVHFALYCIATDSSWMRWQEAQSLANNGRSLSERHKMHLAETVFRMRTEKSELTIRGRRRGELEYQDVSPDFWKNTYLEVRFDKRTLWCAAIKPRDGLDEEAIKQIPDYVSLLVKEEKVREFWPPKDKRLDAETKRLLKQAKKRQTN